MSVTYAITWISTPVILYRHTCGRPTERGAQFSPELGVCPPVLNYAAASTTGISNATMVIPDCDTGMVGVMKASTDGD